LGRRKHTAEEIIGKLRQAEVALAQGIAVPDVCRRLGVTEQTYYRWRKEYGGLGRDQARRLKDLGRENSRLKKLVAGLILECRPTPAAAGFREKPADTYGSRG